MYIDGYGLVIHLSLNRAERNSCRRYLCNSAHEYTDSRPFFYDSDLFGLSLIYPRPRAVLGVIKTESRVTAKLFLEVKTFSKVGRNSSDMDENPCKMKLTVLTETSKSAAVQTPVSIAVKRSLPNPSVNFVLYLHHKC